MKRSIPYIANWNPISGVLSTISGVILVMVQEVFGCTIRCVNALSGFILGAVPRSVWGLFQGLFELCFLDFLSVVSEILLRGVNAVSRVVWETVIGLYLLTFLLSSFLKAKWLCCLHCTRSDISVSSWVVVVVPVSRIKVSTKFRGGPLSLVEPCFE